MIDWDEVSKAENEEQLKKVKLWLFHENIRLDNERRELEQAKEKFLSERVRYKKEMEELNRRTVLERKRLREENLFFDKKMAILQDGFRKLEEDRLLLEKKRKSFMREQAREREQYAGEYSPGTPIAEVAVKLLFRSIKNHPLELRKRYRDLIKIFHPDNHFGDEELVQMINREYLRRKKEE